MSASPACRANIQIIYYPYPIRVSYDGVRDLVPRLFSVYEQNVDIVLHIGMAPGRSFYSIEKQAHREGYHEKQDVDGKVLEKTDGETVWSDCPAVLQTSLNFDDVFDRWHAGLLTTPGVSPYVNGVEVRKSEDAGHYMCDFIYYSMLAEYRKHRDPHNDYVDQMPVMFLHVPGSSTSEDIRKGKAVTITLIQALAESWLHGKTSHQT